VLLSMTGYASKTVSLKAKSSDRMGLHIEMKTINSRFFEVVCKLPSMLNSLEVDIIRSLQKKLLRGRAYVSVKFENDSDAFGAIQPSLKNVNGYLQAAQKIQKTHKLTESLTISDLFQLPNVFMTSRQQLSEQERKAVMKAVGQAAEQLMKTRQEEGQSLQVDILKRFAICGKKIVEVEKRSKKLIVDLKKTIELRKIEIEKGDELAKLKLDDCYSTLNKIDIHEEIIRFKSHLGAVATLIKGSNKENGKRLDFILQELLRETNTMMAKCSNFEISSCCVDIKVELEKAREQAQNIV